MNRLQRVHHDFHEGVIRFNKKARSKKDFTLPLLLAFIIIFYNQLSFVKLKIDG